MTPTEIKALRLLQNKGRMKATWFAEQMGWPGRPPQGAARTGAGYLARLARKKLVTIDHGGWNNRGYFATITLTGELAVVAAGPESRWGEIP